MLLTSMAAYSLFPLHPTGCLRWESFLYESPSIVPLQEAGELLEGHSVYSTTYAQQQQHPNLLAQVQLES